MIAFKLRTKDLYGKIKSIYSCVYGERPLGGSQRDAVYAFFIGFLGQYRIILSDETASEVRQLLSQKRR